ncbi:MAG: zinc finger-containing protein [Geminicoccaceae bacterium]|nr:zinc finger-containing protein [Geminicoccaceae bacterium]
MWTAETIIALAPDPASAKAGRDLAARRKWSALGTNTGSDGAAVLWGACQGSGKDPYLTRVDTGEPAFKCSCPSRKFPCKHSLGLFLLFVQSPGEFTAGAPPDWVAEWVESRTTRAARKAERDARATEPPPAGDDSASVAKREKATKQAAARVEERERRVAAGVAELGLWLRDLVRQGLSGAATRPASHWENMAARLVDAQAPGAARLVRHMASIPASGEGWPDRLLDRLARLHLLLEAYGRLDSLPPDLAADVRTQLGWTVAQEELLALDGVRDQWGVVGRRIIEEDRLRVQRTWLWGRETRRGALVLHFEPAGVTRSEGKPVDPTLVPGMAFEGTLVFFPSTVPLRAILKERSNPVSWDVASGYASVAEAVAVAADADARMPWIDSHPMLLREAIPTTDTSPWRLRDPAGHSLPLSHRFRDRFRLLAVSGGTSVPLFGEWDGESLTPLTVWGESGAVSV